MNVKRESESPERRSLLDSLQLIAELLNTIAPETTKAAWERFLKNSRPKPGSLAGGPFHAWKTIGGRHRASLVPAVTLDEARRVRQLIASDLRYLQFDREGIPTDEHPLGSLLIKLNELTKRSESASWRCRPLAEARPARGQAVVVLRRRNRNGQLRMERWVTEFQPFGEVATLEESLYAVLGGALLTGELAKLRLCRLCAKYLVVKSAKQEVCRECKITFQNLRRAESGYFKENWGLNRERQLREARKLLRDEIPLANVQAKTKLPTRVLEQLSY